VRNGGRREGRERGRGDGGGSKRGGERGGSSKELGARRRNEEWCRGIAWMRHPCSGQPRGVARGAVGRCDQGALGMAQRQVALCGDGRLDTWAGTFVGPLSKRARKPCGGRAWPLRLIWACRDGEASPTLRATISLVGPGPRPGNIRHIAGGWTGDDLNGNASKCRGRGAGGCCSRRAMAEKGANSVLSLTQFWIKNTALEDSVVGSHRRKHLKTDLRRR